MGAALEKLLEIASPAIAGAPARLDDRSRALAGSLADELEGVLRRRNGFCAFESALHLRATGDAGGEIGLQRWNSAHL